MSAVVPGVSTRSTSGWAAAKPARSRTFERADYQRTARRSVVIDGAAGIDQQPPDANGIRQQAPAGIGQRDAAVGPMKKLGTELVFERANA
jgi:hypothetical protein